VVYITSAVRLLFLQAKGLFQKLQVPAKVIELDTMKGGDDLQLGLQVRLSCCSNRCNA
jgi:hypothetical protein